MHFYKPLLFASVLCFTLVAWSGFRYFESVNPEVSLESQSRTSLWQWPSLSNGLDVMVPSNAVDVGGKIVYPHARAQGLSGVRHSRQFLSDVLHPVVPGQSGIYTRHSIRGPTMSPKEAQAYFLANAIMDGREAQKPPSVVVPPNAHWVGMVKDNGGKFHYADGAGKVFDKKQEDLVPRKTWVRTKGGLVSIDALRKAYKEAGKYLKTADNQILTQKHTGKLASKGANHGEEKATAHNSVSNVEVPKEVEGKEALQNAASALSKITTDLKVGKSKDLAAVANKLADVSAHIGSSILKKQGAPEAAQRTFINEAESTTPHPKKNKLSLNRELRIEMDLHARLFGKGGLCTRGAFQKSAVCRTLSGANWDAAWAKVIQDMGPL